jgi:hypothetical protein
MALWLTQSFPRLEELVAFLNARNMASTQFKIVAGQDPRGAHLYYLVYTDEESPPSGGARHTAAELLPEPAEGNSIRAGTAVEQAEAIIHDHETDD